MAAPVCGTSSAKRTPVFMGIGISLLSDAAWAGSNGNTCAANLSLRLSVALRVPYSCVRWRRPTAVTPSFVQGLIIERNRAGFELAESVSKALPQLSSRVTCCPPVLHAAWRGGDVRPRVATCQLGTSVRAKVALGTLSDLILYKHAVRPASPSSTTAVHERD